MPARPPAWPAAAALLWSAAAALDCATGALGEYSTAFSLQLNLNDAGMNATDGIVALQPLGSHVVATTATTLAVLSVNESAVQPVAVFDAPWDHAVAITAALALSDDSLLLAMTDGDAFSFAFEAAWSDGAWDRAHMSYTTTCDVGSESYLAGFLQGGQTIKLANGPAFLLSEPSAYGCSVVLASDSDCTDALCFPVSDADTWAPADLAVGSDTFAEDDLPSLIVADNQTYFAVLEAGVATAVDDVVCAELGLQPPMALAPVADRTGFWGGASMLVLASLGAAAELVVVDAGACSVVGATNVTSTAADATGALLGAVTADANLVLVDAGSGDVFLGAPCGSGGLDDDDDGGGSDDEEELIFIVAAGGSFVGAGLGLAYWRQRPERQRQEALRAREQLVSVNSYIATYRRLDSIEERAGSWDSSASSALGRGSVGLRGSLQA